MKLAEQLIETTPERSWTRPAFLPRGRIYPRTIWLQPLRYLIRNKNASQLN
jgi:hypothetical protein